MNGELSSTPREHARLGTEPIDGLRGFAVLIVVLYHTWLFSWLNPSLDVFGRDVGIYAFVRPGYLGVEIFFVISAFCLAFPYVQADERGMPPPSLGDFVKRRALKIVPSYYLVLAATIAFSASMHAVPAGQWNRVIWQHLFFVQNFQNDLLGDQNSVLWSLAVEVQFYVAFPVLIRLFLKRPVAATFGMIVVAQLYRHLNAACCLHDEDVMRMLPAYLDVFGIGMLAAFAVVRLPVALPWLERHRWVGTLAGAAGAYAIFLQLGYLDDRTYEKDLHELFLLSGRTVFGLAVGLCAVGSCLGYAWWRKLIGNRVLTALSLVSYNVYLWHTLIEIFFAEHRIPYTSLKVPHDDANWRLPYVATSFVTIAFVTIAITYFIERPLLGFIKPQSFAYPWGRLIGRARPASVRRTPVRVAQVAPAAPLAGEVTKIAAPEAPRASRFRAGP